MKSKFIRYISVFLLGLIVISFRMSSVWATGTVAVETYTVQDDKGLVERYEANGLKDVTQEFLSDPNREQKLQEDLYELLEINRSMRLENLLEDAIYDYNQSPIEYMLEVAAGYIARNFKDRAEYGEIRNPEYFIEDITYRLTLEEYDELMYNLFKRKVDLEEGKIYLFEGNRYQLYSIKEVGYESGTTLNAFTRIGDEVIVELGIVGSGYNTYNHYINKVYEAGEGFYIVIFDMEGNSELYTNIRENEVVAVLVKEEIIDGIRTYIPLRIHTKFQPLIIEKERL